MREKERKRKQSERIARKTIDENEKASNMLFAQHCRTERSSLHFFLPAVISKVGSVDYWGIVILLNTQNNQWFDYLSTIYTRILRLVQLTSLHEYTHIHNHSCSLINNVLLKVGSVE